MSDSSTKPDTNHENSFNPRSDGSDYKYFADNDKEHIRDAFNAGREYERSLFYDVLNTIVQQVRLYRKASEP